jgi:hypothetical protein
MPSTSTRESIAVGVQEIELPSIVYGDPMTRAGVVHRAGTRPSSLGLAYVAGPSCATSSDP